MVDIRDPVSNYQDADRQALDRLAELMTLRAGWLDGEGEPVTELAFRAATLILRSLPVLRDRAGIFPTPNGGVAFELETNGWNLSVECSERGEFELHGVEIDSEATLGPKHYSTLSNSLLHDIGAIAHESRPASLRSAGAVIPTGSPDLPAQRLAVEPDLHADLDRRRAFVMRSFIGDLSSAVVPPLHEDRKPSVRRRGRRDRWRFRRREHRVLRRSDTAKWRPQRKPCPLLSGFLVPRNGYAKGNRKALDAHRLRSGLAATLTWVSGDQPEV